MQRQIKLLITTGGIAIFVLALNFSSSLHILPWQQIAGVGKGIVLSNAVKPSEPIGNIGIPSIAIEPYDTSGKLKVTVTAPSDATANTSYLLYSKQNDNTFRLRGTITPEKGSNLIIGYFDSVSGKEEAFVAQAATGFTSEKFTAFSGLSNEVKVNKGGTPMLSSDWGTIKNLFSKTPKIEKDVCRVEDNLNTPEGIAKYRARLVDAGASQRDLMTFDNSFKSGPLYTDLNTPEGVAKFRAQLVDAGASVNTLRSFDNSFKSGPLYADRNTPEGVAKFRAQLVEAGSSVSTLRSYDNSNKSGPLYTDLNTPEGIAKYRAQLVEAGGSVKDLINFDNSFKSGPYYVDTATRAGRDKLRAKLAEAGASDAELAEFDLEMSECKPHQSAYIIASKNPIKYGESINILWTSAGTKVCYATEGNKFNTKGKTEGKYPTGPLTKTTTYSISCYLDPDVVDENYVTSSVTVNVGPKPVIASGCITPYISTTTPIYFSNGALIATGTYDVVYSRGALQYNIVQANQVFQDGSRPWQINPDDYARRFIVMTPNIKSAWYNKPVDTINSWDKAVAIIESGATFIEEEGPGYQGLVYAPGRGWDRTQAEVESKEAGKYSTFVVSGNPIKVGIMIKDVSKDYVAGSPTPEFCIRPHVEGTPKYDGQGGTW